jgi:endonuclease/exonuclease/phosphatase family metal-dependent hydrolase
MTGLRGRCRGGGGCALLLAALVGAAACVRRVEDSPGAAPDAAPPGDAGAASDGAPPSRIPGRGAAATLDIASWNLEWFGDPAYGPADDALQLQNARDVIAGTDFDLWGLVEVVDAARWASLESQLPGYAGILANDPAVIDGAAYYSGFGNAEQKVGLLYKSSLATVLDARVILTAYDYAFGGRPPLQVRLRVTLNGATEDIVVIVQHPKCCTDLESWQRRVDASNALKAYLDATFPTQKVWVIGDFNDDLDTSITAGHASPYASFVGDPDHYRFPTQALTLAGVATTVRFASTIDHHLNTNAANALYIADSVTAYRVDQYISGYGDTTSDHYPVLSRYAWGAAPARR